MTVDKPKEYWIRLLRYEQEAQISQQRGTALSQYYSGILDLSTIINVGNTTVMLLTKSHGDLIKYTTMSPIWRIAKIIVSVRQQY